MLQIDAQYFGKQADIAGYYHAAQIRLWLIDLYNILYIIGRTGEGLLTESAAATDQAADQMSRRGCAGLNEDYAGL
ncbi:hypothetical protein [Nitratireductor soli]|uniref:hypothetical protein n=1 Tax=Nitratireductor soli TaxID=1670619 RepID=UPI0012F81A20|nr:hypothetical protein [Nitratireductor soli]